VIFVPVAKVRDGDDFARQRIDRRAATVKEDISGVCRNCGECVRDVVVVVETKKCR
jgi:hypothetical protein